MKRIGLVFLFIVVAFVNAIGCLNDLELKDHTVITNDGSYAMDSGYDGIPTGHRFVKAKLVIALKRLDSLWKATHDIDYYSDYALVLILQGKYEDAKNSYLEIEKIKPGRYETASNLGTVYELLGDDKNALKWIKRGIKINPKSHYNSEWLHVKILEAKIKGDSFITSDFLLNTNFGGDTIPVSKLSSDELWKLKTSLVYQLNERMTFIKTQNKIMAHLLFDLANTLTLINDNKENALAVYKMAKEYGYSDSLLDIRMKYLEPKRIQDSIPQTLISSAVQKPVTEPDCSIWLVLGMCFILLVIVGITFFKKKKN